MHQLTDEQRAVARARAIDVRRRRAQAKSAVKAGRLRLSEVVEQARHDDALAGMRVRDLIASLPGVGDVKTRQIMEHVGIAPTRRIAGLGGRQGAELVAIFG